MAKFSRSFFIEISTKLLKNALCHNVEQSLKIPGFVKNSWADDFQNLTSSSLCTNSEIFIKNHSVILRKVANRQMPGITIFGGANNRLLLDRSVFWCNYPYDSELVNLLL